MLTGVWTELMRAVRRLARARTFSLIGILTLALGAGALGTVYAVAKALFLDPLPYPEPERIVVLQGEMRRDDVRSWPLGVLDVRDLRAADAGMLGPVPVAGGRGLSVMMGERAIHANGELVGADYFAVFGLTPHQGRFFTAAEEIAPAMSVAVLSHRFWQQHFGGAEVTGRTLVVNEHPVEVVGVAPPSFHGLYDGADLWLPLGSAAALYQPGYLEVREFRWLAAVGRLDPGSTGSGAEERMTSALRTLEASFPREYEGLYVRVVPLTNHLFGDFRQPVWILLAAAALVLGIACTNLAALLLVRGLSQRRETALRRALGARTGHVVGPIVAELALLVAAGSALGLLAAQVTVRTLSQGAGVNLPGFVVPTVDGGVALVTVLVCLVTGLLFGGVPALLAGAARPSLESGAQRLSASTGGKGRKRLQAGLVAAESALAVLLLVGTGLLVRGLSTWMGTDLGFEPAGVTAMRVNLATPRYADDAAYLGFAESLVDASRRIPAVDGVALEGPGYPTSGSFGLHFWNDNAPGGPQDVMAYRHHVTPGYFDLLGIEFLEGRDFTLDDRGSAGEVLVVGKSFADLVWPGESPIGRPIRTSRGAEMTMTVVGVVDDVRHQGLSGNTFTGPQVYLPLLRYPPKAPAAVTLLVRGGPTTGLGNAMRDALAAADPTLPAVEVVSLEEAVRAQTGRNRLLATLMALFATLALALASVGIYGVVGYTVEQGARDLGIRKAIGADHGSIVGHVMRGGFTPVGVGLVAGFLAVPAVQRLVASQLHGIDPYDPVALAAAVGTLVGVAFAATLLPALRAARIDPLRILRGE